MEEQLQAFTDAGSISSYARQGALICTRYGIFSGKSKGELAPKDNFTRAEGAAVIIRFLEKAELI